VNPANLLARRDLLEFYLSAPWFLGGGKDKGWRQAGAIAAIDPVEGCLARADYWQDLVAGVCRGRLREGPGVEADAARSLF